jgi:hypothetical protein
MRAQVATFVGWLIPSQFARSQATKEKKKRERFKGAGYNYFCPSDFD